MDKDTLKKYRNCKARAAYLLTEIERIRRENSVHDVVSGSQKDFPYIKRTSSVDGCPDDLIPDSKLSRYRAEYENCRHIVLMVDAFMETITDETIRQIIKWRYIDGKFPMKWNVIARHIGGNTADSVRMAVERFLHKN